MRTFVAIYMTLQFGILLFCFLTIIGLRIANWHPDGLD